MKQTKEKVRTILLVADRPGWAFHHRAKDMMAIPSSTLQFDLKYLEEVTAKDMDQYDLIYAMSVWIATNLYKKGIPLNKLAAGITSMRQFNRHMINEHTFKEDFLYFFNNLRGVNTVSDEFVQKFIRYRYIHKTRVGINENIFKPSKYTIQPTFTAGWVGRIDGSEHRELKGYDLVLSAIKGLDMDLDIRTFT